MFRRNYPPAKISAPMPQLSADTFSHRIHAYDSETIQFSIASEDIIRKNFGRINIHRLTFTNKDGTTSQNFEEAIDSLFDILNIKYKNYGDKNNEKHKIVGISDDLAFMAEIQYSEKSDDDIITGINLVVVCTVSDCQEKIVATLLKHNFNLEEKIYSADKTRVPVKFAFPGDQYPEIRNSHFTRLSFEKIKDNYLPAVENQFNSIVNKVNSTKSGLLIFNGLPGTGKSYFIRGLLSALTDRHGVVCAPARYFLNDVGQLGQVLATVSKSVIILEDVGDLLAIENVTHHVDETANLLNLTEGLMSLLSDTIFLLTFNYEVSQINPALLRYGRCLGRIEFKLLPHSHAERLVGFEIPKRAYTLAEIYAMKNTGKPLETEDNIGSNSRKSLFIR